MADAVTADRGICIANTTTPATRKDVTPLNRITELIVERGKAMVMEAVASAAEEDNSDEPVADADNQLSLDDLVKPVDWPEDKNWGTLTIDASCTPADNNYPTVLKLTNEARESAESIIDDLIEKRSGLGGHRPRYDHGKARANYLYVAKQKRTHRRKIISAIRRQFEFLHRNLDANDALIASGAWFSHLKTQWWQKFTVISKLHRISSMALVRAGDFLLD